MTDDERSDADLLGRAANGDGAAFTKLVRRHIRAATLLAAQLLGDRDDADDIVQDAFTLVYRKARSFDPSRPFGPWFFAIVRRLAANKHARDQRRQRLLRVVGWANREPSVRAAPEALARFDAEAVERALKDLSPMQRACFELVAIRGLSIEEVAVMHGIAESTVRQHVFRARTTMRRVLEGRTSGALTDDA